MTSALPMIVPQPTHTRRTGKPTGQKPPLQPKEVWAIRVRLQIAGRGRDLALFNLAIDSKLRGCDLVCLKVGDIAQICERDRRSSLTSDDSVNARFSLNTNAQGVIGKVANVPNP